MSHLAIDQLFQITTPAPTGREPVRANQSDGNPFRAHLDRAADAAEPKLRTDVNANKPTEFEEDEPVEPQTDQQETSTADQEQTAAASDTADTSAEAKEETSPTEETADEVTLSTAAAAQAAAENSEVVVAAGQEVSLEVVAESTPSDNQQQPQGQPSELAVETPEEAAAVNVDGNELGEALLEGDAGGKTASGVEELNTSAANVTTPLETTTSTAATQSTVSSAEQEKAKKSQGAATFSSTSTEHDGEQKLPESDAAEKSTQTTTGRFDVPVITATVDLALAAEADLALANLNNTSEPVASSPNSSTHTTETVAAAGRAVGNLLAGKPTNTANTTTEASTTETPTVDRAKFVQRVGGAIRSAQQRDGQIQLRLSPPELGTLRINIVLSEGVLTAQLETETAAARNVLLDNLPALRERLAEQEIRIEKFDVNVGQEGQQQTDDPETEDRQANGTRSRANQPTSRKNPSQATVEPSLTQPVTASGLDVRI